MFSAHPLRSWLALRIILAGLVPLAVIAALVSGVLLPQLRADLEIRHQTLARTTAGQIEAHLLGARRELYAVAEYIRDQGYRPAPFWFGLLDAHVGTGDVFAAIYLVAADDSVYAVGLPQTQRRQRDDLLGLDLSKRLFLRETRERNEAAWSETFLSTVTGRLAVALTIPMAEQVLVGEIAIDRLSEFLGHSPAELEMLSMILDRKSQIIVHSQANLSGQQLSLGYLPIVRDALQGRFATRSVELDGEMFVGTPVGIPQLGWIVLVAQSRNEAFRAFLSTLWVLAAGALVALLLAILVALMLARGFARRIGRYAEQAHAIAEGDYDQPWPIAQIQEFDSLAGDLERMSLAIRQRERDLATSEARYRSVIGNAPVIIFQFDEQGIFTLSEGKGLARVGLAAGEAVGQSLFELYRDYPEVCEYARRAIAGEPLQFSAWIEDACFDVYFNPARDGDDPVPVMGLLVDVTERKRAEDSLRASHALLDAIGHVQSLYITGADTHVVFDTMLSALLAMTESEYGFVGEVLREADGAPYLKIQTITNIAWDEATRTFHATNVPQGMEFRNLDTLFGAVITSARPVLSNDPVNDPRKYGTPPDHPPLNSFMGLPFFCGKELVGMVGVANRKEGYHEEMVARLQPLLNTCASVVQAIRENQQRRRAEEALRENEARLRTAIESIPFDFFLIDTNGRYVLQNSISKKYWGDVVGKRPEDIADDPAILAHWKNNNSRAFAGEVVEEEVRLTIDDQERCIHNIIAPIKDRDEIRGIVGLNIDITERKQAEESLRRINRQLRMLSDCNQALIRTNDEIELLAAVCAIAVGEGGYRMAWVGYAERDAAKSMRPMAHAGFEEGYLQNASISWADDERGRSPIGTAVRTGRPNFVQNIASDSRFAPWRVEAVRRGYAAACALPLIDGNRIFGALGIYSSAPDAFDAKEIELLSELASDLAFGIIVLRARTERERANRALQESEFLLRKSQEVGDLGSYYFDARTATWVSSEKLDQIFGIDGDFPKTVNGWLDVIHPDDREEVHRHLTGHVLTEHNKFDKEYRIVRRNDGQERWVHGLGELEFDENGVPIKLIGTIQDITRSKRVDRALQESEHKYRELVENANSIILRWNRQGEIVFINEFGLKFFGYSREELIGRHVVGTIVPLDDRTGRDLRPLMDEICLHPERFERNVNENVRRNGERVWIAWTNRAVLDEQGHVVEVFSVGSDITDRKRVEAALQESERLFRAVFEQAPHFVGILDLEGNVLKANATATNFAQIRPEDVYGKPFWKTPWWQHSQEQQEQLREAIRRAAQGELIRFETTHPAHDGALHSVDFTLKPVRNEAGKVVMLLPEGQDITERKRAEAELRRHREHLEELVAERTAELHQAMNQLVQSEKLAALGHLVAGVAHELNTPLGNARVVASSLGEALREFAAAVGSGALRRSQVEGFLGRGREAVDLLERNTARAADLIGQFKQVAVDQTSARRRRFDLRQTVGELLVTLRPQLKHTAHRIELDIPPAIELDSYPGPLEQVFANLITNSLTHGFAGIEAGVIRIRAAPLGPDQVRIDYADDGAGIPEALHSRIFEPFFTTRLGSGGSGLGLYIVYNLVTGVLGGTVRVHSQPGQGATFALILPSVVPDSRLHATGEVAP